MQGTDNDIATLVVSVLGPVVLPATFNVVSLDPAVHGLIGYVSPVPSDWITRPEAPPPRA